MRLRVQAVTSKLSSLGPSWPHPPPSWSTYGGLLLSGWGGTARPVKSRIRPYRSFSPWLPSYLTEALPLVGETLTVTNPLRLPEHDRLLACICGWAQSCVTLGYGLAALHACRAVVCTAWVSCIDVQGSVALCASVGAGLGVPCVGVHGMGIMHRCAVECGSVCCGSVRAPVVGVLVGPDARWG